MSAETPPPGYKAAKVRVTIKQVEYRLGHGVEFVIANKVRDDYAGDFLGSFSRDDYIGVFRKARYSEQQIAKLLAALRDDAKRDRNGYGWAVLPKPIHATITVLRHSFGGGKRRHARPAAPKKPRRTTSLVHKLRMRRWAAWA